MAVAVPAEAMGGRRSFGDDQLPSGPEAPDRGPAQDPGRLHSERALGRHRAGGRLPGPLSSVPLRLGGSGRCTASRFVIRSLMAHRRSTTGHDRPAAEAIYGDMNLNGIPPAQGFWE